MRPWNVLGQAFRDRARAVRHTHGRQTGLARNHTCSDFISPPLLVLGGRHSTEGCLFMSTEGLLTSGVLVHIEVDI